MFDLQLVSHRHYQHLLAQVSFVLEKELNESIALQCPSTQQRLFMDSGAIKELYQILARPLIIGFTAINGIKKSY